MKTIREFKSTRKHKFVGCRGHKAIEIEGLKWINELALKQLIIDNIRELPIWCKCGARAVIDYEGDLICPVFEKEFDKTDRSLEIWEKLLEKHSNAAELGSWKDLGKFEILKEIFEIKDEEINEK